MIQPAASQSSGSQASPASGKVTSPTFGNVTSPASGSFTALSQPVPESSSSAKSPSANELIAKIEQLRHMPGQPSDWQTRLDKVLETLRSHEQGDKAASDTLMEAVSQLWQRQSQEPATMEQMQQFLAALQKTLAEQPNSEQLISQLRGMQDIRPVPLGQNARLTVGDLQKQAPHQIGKIANGAPMAPLQAQALLTQPQIDAQLLSQLTTAALNGEQLSELTNLAQLRQAQPQLPVTAGAMNRAMPGTVGHEFSPLTLDKQTSMWAEQMLAPLTERLRVQSQLGVKQATLRLDPPNLGKLDLQVRTEDDRVFIQISATNPMVRDQLLQLSDRLRQDILHGQAYSQVSVEIGQPGGEQPAGQGQHNGGNNQNITQAIEGHEEQEWRSLATTSDYNLDTYV